MPAINIVSKSRVASEMRIDADFYHPYHESIDKKISNLNYTNLGNEIDVITDYHANGSYETLKKHVTLLDKPDYALMIRTKDFEDDEFEKNVKHITESAYNFLAKTKLYGGEVVINKIGNAGRVYIVPFLDRPVSLGMNQLMIRTSKRINNFYLYTYLKTKYGASNVKKRIIGSVPFSYDKMSVRKIKVPFLSNIFQEEVGKLVIKHLQLLKEGKHKYKQALKIITDAVGEIKCTERFSNNTYIKSFSGISYSKRLDSQFFHPKYDEIFKAISSVGYSRIGDVANLAKGTQVSNTSNEGVLCASIKDVKKGIIHTKERTKQKRIITIQPEDLVYAITGATIGKVGINIYDELVAISGDLVRISPYAINPYYLLAALDTDLLKTYSKRYITGATNGHMSSNDVAKIPIPLINDKDQQKVIQLIKDCFKLCEKSADEMNIAKMAVETAIEQGEEHVFKMFDYYS